jgi:hypothetical protein
MKKKFKIVILFILVLMIFIIIFFISKNNTANNLSIDANKNEGEETIFATEDNLITFDCVEQSWDIKKDYDKDFGHDYFAKDGKVYFLFAHIEQPGLICELLSADYETFEVLDFVYAKDNNHVYFRYSELKTADPATFKIVSEGGLAKDRYNVYSSGQILPGLDSDSLESLGPIYYMRTKDGIFIKGLETVKRMKDVDLETFEAICPPDYVSCVNSSYDARDKNHYYKAGVIVDFKD